MPLVLDPDRLPPGMLEDLCRELREGLSETLESILNPRGRVLDATSLDTAAELVRASMAILDRPGARSATGLGEEANLAYAATLAAIDLVKTHTDVPRVPAPRRR